MKDLLNQNPDWLTDLDNYTIPEIKTIYNLPVQIDTKTEENKIKELTKLIETGKTLKQIHNEIDKRELRKKFDKTFGNYLLQLENINYEMVDKKSIWRNPQLTKS